MRHLIPALIAAAALAAARAAAAAEPENAAAHHLLGVCLQRAGDAAGARQALAGAPGDLDAARAAIDRHAARRDKRPWAGGVLGLVPGLGYAYSGEYANAVRSLILNSLFLWGMVETACDDDWAVFSALTFVELTWYTGSIYGGIDAAHRHNERRLDAATSDIRGGPRLQPDLARVPLIALQFTF